MLEESRDSTIIVTHIRYIQGSEDNLGCASPTSILLGTGHLALHLYVSGWLFSELLEIKLQFCHKYTGITDMHYDICSYMAYGN